MNTNKQQQEIWNEIGAREDYKLFIKGDMTQGWQEGVRHELSGEVDAKETYVKLKERGIDMKGKTVLEIGCGNGRMTSYFKKLGANIEGLDISKSLLDRLGKKDKKIKTYLGYNLNIIPNNKYDIIISFMTFQHCNKEAVYRYFQQGLSKLKDGGYFVFQLPVANDSSEMETKFIDYTGEALKGEKRYLLDGVRLKTWDRGEFEMLKDGYTEIGDFVCFADAFVFIFKKNETGEDSNNLQ
jgi:cyclopropane fatty-acyl-phospholipid synthase-like methyltransferase